MFFVFLHFALLFSILVILIFWIVIFRIILIVILRFIFLLWWGFFLFFAALRFFRFSLFLSFFLCIWVIVFIVILTLLLWMNLFYLFLLRLFSLLRLAFTLSGPECCKVVIVHFNPRVYHLLEFLCTTNTLLSWILAAMQVSLCLLSIKFELVTKTKLSLPCYLLLNFLKKRIA